MYFKEQRYQKAKASTLASTHKVELPDTGLLDSITLYLRAVNASDVSGAAPGNIYHHITKVEVIGNTDKTLFSLTGEELLAKAYRKLKKLPPFKQNEYNLKSQDLIMPIFFGRRYKDGHYALDLSKWDKVELQVTNDFTTSLITSLSMETRLCTIEDAVETYAKFLKQWEYDATKPDADGDYVRPKLPTTGLLRELMIQLDPDISATTGAVTADPAGDSYNWKLWFKDRALTIRDHRPRDLMRDEHLLTGLGIGHSSCKPYPSTTRYTDFHWAEVLQTSIVDIGTVEETEIHTTLADNRDRYQVAAQVGGGDFYQVLIHGVGLFHTFAIPFYVEDLETEYLNLEHYKPIEIEWYGYKDDNTHRMILEKPIGQGPTEYA